MPQNDFKTERHDYDEGYCFCLKYAGKGILQFEHRKDPTKIRDYLNYNIHIPSDKTIIDNVNFAMEFLKKLEEKGARTLEHALKDADMYYGTIYEGQKQESVAFGYRSSSELGINMPFDVEEIRKAIENNGLNFVIMKTRYGSVAIEVCDNRDFSYLNVAEQPITEVRIDGFDTSIAKELADLTSQTGCTKIPGQDLPRLENYLVQILSQFKAVKVNPSQPQQALI
jgi:hypothetical protein